MASTQIFKYVVSTSSNQSGYYSNHPRLPISFLVVEIGIVCIAAVLC